MVRGRAPKHGRGHHWRTSGHPPPPTYCDLLPRAGASQGFASKTSPPRLRHLKPQSGPVWPKATGRSGAARPLLRPVKPRPQHKPPGRFYRLWPLRPTAGQSCLRRGPPPKRRLQPPGPPRTLSSSARSGRFGRGFPVPAPAWRREHKRSARVWTGGARFILCMIYNFVPCLGACLLKSPPFYLPL